MSMKIIMRVFVFEVVSQVTKIEGIRSSGNHS